MRFKTGGAHSNTDGISDQTEWVEADAKENPENAEGVDVMSIRLTNPYQVVLQNVTVEIAAVTIVSQSVQKGLFPAAKLEKSTLSPPIYLQSSLFYILKQIVYKILQMINYNPEPHLTLP